MTRSDGSTRGLAQLAGFLTSARARIESRHSKSEKLWAGGWISNEYSCLDRIQLFEECKLWAGGWIFYDCFLQGAADALRGAVEHRVVFGRGEEGELEEEQETQGQPQTEGQEPVWMKLTTCVRDLRFWEAWGGLAGTGLWGVWVPVLVPSGGGQWHGTAGGSQQRGLVLITIFFCCRAHQRAFGVR